MSIICNMSNPHHDASPALTLTLAGIFQGSGAADGRMEIGSSENSSAIGKSQSNNEVEDREDERKRRRLNCNRHTPQQISLMEAVFKESPHPDEKQRKELSKELGLHPKQVKFWFQNRRTQIKAIQERHEISLLKSEVERLRYGTSTMINTKEDISCPSCGFAFPAIDTITSTEAQRLIVENSKLKAEVEELRSIVKQTSQTRSLGNKENESSSHYHVVMDRVNQSMNELLKMATCGEPLWMRRYETEREVLNYDEYRKEFCDGNSDNMQQRKCIEVSRESAVVFADPKQLLHSFMDVNQWTALFPCLVSKAATLSVIANGEGVYKDGAVQLMFAEIQMLTPMVATRQLHFVRYCKQLGPNQWGIVDVSVDQVEDKMDASRQKCQKRPSGCIIENEATGRCKVTWVEHLECQKSRVHSLYLSMINSGLAFGAKHWITTLQQQCEQNMFFHATNVPPSDSSGIDTHAGRKSLLKLAQRMTLSFCRAIGASSYNSWTKFITKSCEDIRLTSRKNMDDFVEPSGIILCAASSVWLPVSRCILFDFLRDEKRRHEWDVMANGNPVQSIANLAKGQDRENSVSVLAMRRDEQDIRVLQDSSTNAFESTVIYSPIETSSLQSILSGSSNTAILASGFSILPDGIESRPSVISKTDKDMEGGSLLTIAFQIPITNTPTVKVPKESVDSINALVSCTLQNIKKSLHCED